MKISPNLIEGKDYKLEKIENKIPKNDNTYDAVISSYGGSTTPVRPKFDKYIQATSAGTVEQSSQKTDIINNFQNKCNILTNSFAPKKIGGSRRKKYRKKYTRRRKRKRYTYRRKSIRKKKSRKNRR